MKLYLLLAKLFGVVILVCLSAVMSAQSSKTTFKASQNWLDTDGIPIQAHAGGIVYSGDTYYWYGENHMLGAGNKIGISCYSSKDLYRWKNEGVVLPKDSLPMMFRDSGVCERPKVLYNARTKKYVMWMHLDDSKYSAAMAGVAISDSPAGTFTFLGYKRPIHYDYGYRKEPRFKGVEPNERELGNTYADMALFLDDDGKAYVIYASEDDETMYCVQLDTDFTDLQLPAVKGKTWDRILINQQREAPAPFKFNGKYYIISSGTSGWDPNPAQVDVADNILRPWKSLGDPCMGQDALTTFRSQSTYVLPAPGKPPGNFIYMGDRWNGAELAKSTYVWLPFKMNAYGGFKLAFFDQWNLSLFDKPNTVITSPVIKESTLNSISWKPVEGADGYKIFKNGHFISFTRNTQFEIPKEFAGQVFNYTVQAWQITGKISKPSNIITKKWINQKDVYLSDMPAESSKQGWGYLQKDKSIQLPLIRIAGHEFKKGLGTHAPSEIVYRICGNYSKFSAWIGVDDFAIPYNEASVQFEVWGDGTLLYQSKIMRANDSALLVNVAIRGINELKLVVNDAGDGQAWDHANWAEAKVSIEK